MPMMLEITTAERQVFGEEVDMVIAPGVDGQLGILPRHAPLMTMLRPGELTIRKGGADSYFAVSGGFLEVLANRVTILADACENSEEINEERAQEAMRRAQERIASRPTDMQMQRALASLRRAQARLETVRRRRPRSGQLPPTVSSG